MIPAAILRPAVFALAAPTAAAGLIFAALQAQSPKTWARLMPDLGIHLPDPGRDLLLITATDQADHVAPVLHTAAFRGTACTWIVLRERVTDHFRPHGPDGSAGFLALGVDGAFARPRIDDDGRPAFEPSAVPPDLVRAAADDVQIIAESEAVLAAARARFPALGDRGGLLLADVVRPPSEDLSARYGTALQAWAVIPRLAAWLAWLTVAGLLAWRLADAPAGWRAVIAVLAVPAAAGVGIALTALTPWTPWLLWSAAAVGAVWADPWVLAEAVAWLRAGRDRPAVAIVLVGAAAYFGSLFHRHELTTGDALRYVHGAKILHEHGRWPVAAVAARRGADDELAVYPPGPSAAMAACLRVVGVEPDRSLLPGRQTGAVWLIYGGLLAVLHAAVWAGVVLAVRQLLPGLRAGWLLASAGWLWAVPSARGWLHGGETLLWPMLAATLVAGIAWRRTGSVWAGGVMIVCAAAAAFTKSEAGVILAVIGVPFLLAITPSPGFALRPAVLVTVAAVALLPQAIWAVEKSAAGVTASPGRMGEVSLRRLAEERRTLTRVLARTARITVGPLNLPDDPKYLVAAHHGGLLLALAAAVWVRAQIRGWRGRRLLLPAGLSSYWLAMSAAYTFSVFAQGRELHVESTWPRLLVPLLMAAGAAVPVFLAEPSDDAPAARFGAGAS